MPPAPVPPEIEEFLKQPNPAVVATLRADGSPHSVATWYDWVDGLILLNMDATRARLGHLRRDPRVSLTVLDKDSWYTHVTLTGVVERLVDDPDLADIDRLALRYQGNPFRNRKAERVSAWMRPDRWYRWD
jgi:PPOX class probable F420-dependent enzyme